MLLETHKALWAHLSAEYEDARAVMDLPRMMEVNDRLIQLATIRATAALNKKTVKDSYHPIRD